MTHPHTMDRKMNALVRALAKEGVPFDIYANRWENETYFNICIPSMDNNKIDVGFAPSTYGYERGEFELLVEDMNEVVRPLKEAVAYIKDYLRKSK